MSENTALVADDRSIQWCLLSHTNIGKTTLTRTLMADDVGEIEDAAHVTTQSQRYLLQKTPQGDELWLWHAGAPLILSIAAHDRDPPVQHRLGHNLDPALLHQFALQRIEYGLAGLDPAAG